MIVMAIKDTEYLVQVMQQARAAKHGQKQAIYQSACEFLGISPQTLHNKLKDLRGPLRNPRSDRGCFELPADEAKVLGAYLAEAFRKNNKKQLSIKTAVNALRANGHIVAGRIDPATGEISHLSESAISRALRGYNLHPVQLRRPTPHVHLKSRHPNHVWQVDASVCTLYYLPDGQCLVETDQAVHYKNKPENLKAIERQRVIRYVLTDHCTGLIRWRYYPHSESAENTLRFLIWAILPKANARKDPFHGAPMILMVDPGATSAGLIKRFCWRLGIELIVNKPGAPRAKGQVENGQNLVEMEFEQGLRYVGKQIRNIDHLNELADVFQVYYNFSAEHSRTKKTRFAGWMRIQREQLRTVHPDVDLFALATSQHETRVVKGDLTISYLGQNRVWKVNNLPFANVGDSVTVCQNPITGKVMAVSTYEDGREIYIELEEATRDEWGFFDEAAPIGEKHISHKDTAYDINRKALAKIAAGEESIEAAEKKRKRKDYQPFDGKVDPYLEAKRAELPDVLPRAGTALAAAPRQVELIRMTLVQMAKWLQGRLGEAYEPAMLADLQKRFPAGATEPELEEVLTDIRAGRSAAGRAKLQAV
jgi:hypothetical protein